MIDAGILQEVLNFSSKCHHCNNEKCLSLFQENKSRRGLSEKLYLKCMQCEHTVKTFYTSKTNDNNLIDINLRSVHAATTSGGGLTMLRTFCSSMDLPPPIHTAPYSKYLKVIAKSAMENCEESMSRAARKLVKDETTLTGIPISIDGTWQKRYMGIIHYLVPHLLYQ